MSKRTQTDGQTPASSVSNTSLPASELPSSGSREQPAEQQLPITEYTDGPIVSYANTQIGATLNGFAANSRYRLQDRQGGIVTAFSDPVNSGRRMAAVGHHDVVSTPISYMFDKSARPLGQAEHDLQQLLDPTLDDDILLAQASGHEIASIRDLVAADDDAASLRPKLQARFDLLQSAHRDVFDEIMPAMNIGADNARIVFPYNTRDGSHWVTGEINIRRVVDGQNNYQYAVDITAHDPLGGGSIDPRDEQELADVVTKRIAEKHNERFQAAQVDANNFQVTSSQSAYGAMVRQHDNVSCGVISVNEMLRRLHNQPIEDINYPPGAIALRQQHIQTMHDTYGADSDMFAAFMRDYANVLAAQEKEAEAEKSSSGKESDVTLSKEELAKAIEQQHMYDLLNSLSSRPALESSASQKPEGTSTEASEKPKKPLHQQKSAEIFTDDPKAMPNFIETIEKGGKKNKTYSYRHVGDPSLEEFPSIKACTDNAVAHVEEWAQQVIQVRDIAARALEEGAKNKPESRGQPKDASEDPRAVQELSLVLHNRVVTEPSEERGWGFVEESEKARKGQAYGATTVNVSVVQFSPKEKPVLMVAENGRDSTMSPYRRAGIELAGGQCINVRDVAIGPWEMPKRDPGRDKLEAYPDERIYVVSNISGSTQTRHAEANTIAFLFGEADAQIRQEMLETGKIKNLYDPIPPGPVKERVKGMLLDTATDKCHCAECTIAMKAVFGERFNSGTPTEDRLFENWREPFPGFSELYPKNPNPYRELNGKLKSGNKSGVLPGKKGIEGFDVNDLPDTSSTPKSPSRFYEDELEAAMLASASEGQAKKWHVPVQSFRAQLELPSKTKQSSATLTLESGEGTAKPMEVSAKPMDVSKDSQSQPTKSAPAQLPEPKPITITSLGTSKQPLSQLPLPDPRLSTSRQASDTSAQLPEPKPIIIPSFGTPKQPPSQLPLPDSRLSTSAQLETSGQPPLQPPFGFGFALPTGIQPLNIRPHAPTPPAKPQHDPHAELQKPKSKATEAEPPKAPPKRKISQIADLEEQVADHSANKAAAKGKNKSSQNNPSTDAATIVPQELIEELAKQGIQITKGGKVANVGAPNAAPNTGKNNSTRDLF